MSRRRLGWKSTKVKLLSEVISYSFPASQFLPPLPLFQLGSFLFSSVPSFYHLHRVVHVFPIPRFFHSMLSSSACLNLLAKKHHLFFLLLSLFHLFLRILSRSPLLSRKTTCLLRIGWTLFEHSIENWVLLVC